MWLLFEGCDRVGRAGVQFVGRGVVREWFGGGDGGDVGRGLPLAGLAGLPLALMLGCRSCWGEVGYHSSCVNGIMCHIEDSIDAGFWRLICT